MALDPAVFLAALGITLLEFSEAAAVGLALYADSKRHVAFLYVALGALAVLLPTLLLGSLIGQLPSVYIRIVGGVLLLYFGIRLVKSARRSVLYARLGSVRVEHFEKGLMTTGFSVGAVEAFEAAIVLIGLLPNGFEATVDGLGLGVVLVAVATYFLRAQVRKVKQANVKVVVSALLLSFAVFWFAEVFSPVIPDLVLIPLFVGFTVAVHAIANGASPGVRTPKETSTNPP